MTRPLSFSEFKLALVEPSAMQSQHVSKMLWELGVGYIQPCQTAAEALLAIDKLGDACVVVSSLYLPDMPGTELVAAMRARESSEATPFILMSSETRPQVLDPIRQSGACSIVTKPFTSQQLERALYAAVDYLQAPAEIEAADLERLHVLLVDDSRTTRRHLTRVLTELGFTRISQAENGVEAVAFLQDNMVDLVITDYNMPEMDGRALVEYIRTQSWQNSVPILMVTSEQNEGRLAAVEKAGVSAICDKPFDAASVRTLLSMAIAQ